MTLPYTCIISIRAKVYGQGKHEKDFCLSRQNFHSLDYEPSERVYFGEVLI